MSIKLKDTIYDLISKSSKDGSGNIITDTYLNKTGGTLKNGTSTSPLILDTNSTEEIGLVLNISGSCKAWVGYAPTFGVYLWNATRKSYLSYRDDGSLYIEDKIVLHSGNWSSYCANKDHSHTNYSLTSHTHTSIKDIGNSTNTTFAYSKAELEYDEYTWLAGWNGYELRAINKSQFAKKSDIPTTLPASDVYAWAKASTKPSYSASEVGAAAKASLSSGLGYGKIARIECDQNRNMLITLRGTNSNRGALIYVTGYGSGTTSRMTHRVIYSTSAYKFYYNGTSESGAFYIKNTYDQGTDSLTVTELSVSAAPSITIVSSLPADAVEVRDVVSIDGHTHGYWTWNENTIKGVKVNNTVYADSAGTANSVAWGNVSGKPSFATVATSGSYNDLSNKPTIPTNNNQLTNGAGYITRNVNTATNTNPFIVSRSGGLVEALKIGVNDNTVYFLHEQDETTSNFVFSGKYNDTESGGGKNAGEKTITFGLSSSDHNIYVGSYAVIHSGTIGSQSVNYATSSTRAKYLETVQNGSWYGDSYKMYAEWSTSTICKLTVSGYTSMVDYSTSATRLYSIDSTYSYTSSNPYYAKLRWNTNGDDRWYLSVYPETPKAIAVDYSYTSSSTYYIKDAGNGTAIPVQYSGAGLSSAQWICCWNGYKIAPIDQANINAGKVDGYHISVGSSAGSDSSTIYFIV